MDSAWKWLKEHDPVFKNRKHATYPYLSQRQLYRRCMKKEIPISNLGNMFVMNNASIKEREVRQVLSLME